MSDATAGEQEGEAAPSTAFSPPPEAGDIRRCNMWYYVDATEGYLQGPFNAKQMREWLEAGYIPLETPVSPSHYGEVPTELWPLSVLWEAPLEQAFVLAADAVVDGTRVFNHGSANNAAGMVREKGAARAVVEGAIPAVGGAAGQALEDGDPVAADAAESFHDEGVDGDGPLFMASR